MLRVISLKNSEMDIRICPIRYWSLFASFSSSSKILINFEINEEFELIVTDDKLNSVIHSNVSRISTIK